MAIVVGGINWPVYGYKLKSQGTNQLLERKISDWSVNRGLNKVQDGLALGADQVIISINEGQMKGVMGNFDVIIDTVPYAHDLNPYIGTLATNGTMGVVGYVGPLEPMLVIVPMIMGRK